MKTSPAGDCESLSKFESLTEHPVYFILLACLIFVFFFFLGVCFPNTRLPILLWHFFLLYFTNVRLLLDLFLRYSIIFVIWLS